MIRHLRTLALALVLLPAAASAQTFTVKSLAPVASRGSGGPLCTTTACVWQQLGTITPAAAPIPPTIEQRLDRIETAVARIGTVAPAAPVAPATPVPVASTLPAMAYDAVLWDFGRSYHASEWGNGLSPIGWKFDHVYRQGTDVVMRLDAAGAPEIKSNVDAHTTGRWEADVTLPALRDGVVTAPLWLWNESGDELDFELAGKRGLDVTMHVRGGTKYGTRLFVGQDLSGRRMRLGIEVQADAVVMLVDGKEAYRFERSAQPTFTSSIFKPYHSMWAADPNNGGFVGWVGSFAPFAAGEKMEMTIHGYRYSAL